MESIKVMKEASRYNGMPVFEHAFLDKLALVEEPKYEILYNGEHSPEVSFDDGKTLMMHAHDMYHDRAIVSYGRNRRVIYPDGTWESTPQGVSGFWLSQAGDRRRNG